jgi:hypothetical protein
MKKQKLDIQRDAVLSPDGIYRYRLSRWWGPGPRLAFLMFNPSTADALVDDATIRKCMGFAQRWAFDGIEVVNLFAIRSREPENVLLTPDPLGPEYWTYLFGALELCTTVVAAWGCESTLKKLTARPHLASHIPEVLKWMRTEVPSPPTIYCFGYTQGGTPRHPLMLPYKTFAVPYKWPPPFFSKKLKGAVA